MTHALVPKINLTGKIPARQLYLFGHLGDDLLQEGIGEFPSVMKDANFVAEGFADALLSRGAILCKNIKQYITLALLIMVFLFQLFSYVVEVICQLSKQRNTTSYHSSLSLPLVFY